MNQTLENGTATLLNNAHYEALLAKIADPNVASSLTNVLDKMDSIETMVSAMDEMMRKMPAILEAAQQQHAIQSRLNEGMMLLEKLSEPNTMRSLSRLLDKLDTIDTMVSALDEMVQKAPQVIEDAQHSSLSPALQEGTALLTKMTEPEVLRSLKGILDKIDSAELMMSVLDEGVKKFGHVLESVQNESHLGETIMSYLEIGEKLGRKEVVGNLNNLLDKIENLDAVLNILDGIIHKNPELTQPDSHTIEALSEMVQAILDSLAKDKTLAQTIKGGLELLNEINRILLSDKMQLIVEGLAKSLETTKYEVPRVGMFGLMKMVNNPDVQRAQGLLFTLLKSIGQKFDEYQCAVPDPKSLKN